MILRVLVLINIVLLISGCAPTAYKPGPEIQEPFLSKDAFFTADGERLPLYRWTGTEAPGAVIIALHGFNDYGLFFDDAASFLNTHGIVSYAYDQRGFGGTEKPGFWAGVDAYITDLKTMIALVQQNHPGLPVYLLGESMGGAVILAAAADTDFPQVSGAILSAPAVWGRSEMPWYQRWLLAMTSYTVPNMKVTGRGLDIKPSDNIEMLRELGRDPLVIKETRVDAIYGLVNLMDKALQSSANISIPLCLLYGERDEIIPVNAVSKMLDSINNKRLLTLALYDNGYHMLLRDLNANIVWSDISNWILQPDQSLPSGAEDLASARFGFNMTTVAAQTKP